LHCYPAEVFLPFFGTSYEVVIGESNFWCNKALLPYGGHSSDVSPCLNLASFANTNLILDCNTASNNTKLPNDSLLPNTGEICDQNSIANRCSPIDDRVGSNNAAISNYCWLQDCICCRSAGSGTH